MKEEFILLCLCAFGVVYFEGGICYFAGTAYQDIFFWISCAVGVVWFSAGLALKIDAKRLLERKS
jgi:hypothetical protein